MGEPGERRYRPVRSWALWQSPPRVRVYVLTVTVVAAAAVVGTGFWVPVTGTAAIRFAVLAGCAAVYIELTRTIERRREFARQGANSPYLDTKSVWSFAAAVVLPPILAMAMVGLTYALAWWRVWPARSGRRPVPLYRWTFSGCSVLLGTITAAAVLAVGMHHFPGLPATTAPAGVLDLAVIVAAGGLRWLINTALVFAAILVSTPHARPADLFDGFAEHSLEAGAMALGVVAAIVLVVNPIALVLIVVAMVALHRAVLVRQYQHQARVDAKTGLLTADWWHEQAGQLLARARARGETVGVLMFDLDHFKAINDEHGHLAGDAALRAVAGALAGETRVTDLVGRWGGEEFAALVTGVRGEPALRSIAERIRRRVGCLVVDVGAEDDPRLLGELTVSVGGAIVPPDGAVIDVDAAVLVADAELYRAKAGGRNQTSIASATR